MTNKGDISELRAIASAMSAGIEVATLHGNGRRFDFLAELHNGEWAKCQVKTARLRKGRWMVETRRSKGVTGVLRDRQYKPGDFDFLIAVGPDCLWVVPFLCVSGKTCVNLSGAYPTDWRALK